jgi:hypothetical protein
MNYTQQKNLNEFMKVENSLIEERYDLIVEVN